MGALTTGCIPEWPGSDAGFSDDMGADDMQSPPRVGYPSGAMADPSNTLLVDALIPTYAATSIATLTPQTDSLPMPMNHLSLQADPAAFSGCANCHNNLGTGGSYYPGLLHSSLANLKLAEPTACSDCHAASMPTGFVGPTATSPARIAAVGRDEARRGGVDQRRADHDHARHRRLRHLPREPVAEPGRDLGHRPRRHRAAQFHASLTAAAQPQPTSCVDCHANTRPTAVLTSANAALPAALQFDHAAPAALGDCASCHAKRPHRLVGRPVPPRRAAPRRRPACPATAASARRRPPAGSAPPTPARRSTTSPTPHGITHGDGQDCATCHAGPGTGAWGGTQNWAGGHFTHGAATAVASTTCIACHSTQRPDLQPGATAAAMATLLGFDHSINGTGDCFGCHQATVAAGTYVNYNNPGTGTLPGGDWKGGRALPGLDADLGAATSSSPSPRSRSTARARYNLVTSISSTTATLYNEMLHISSGAAAGAQRRPDRQPRHDQVLALPHQHQRHRHRLRQRPVPRGAHQLLAPRRAAR